MKKRFIAFGARSPGSAAERWQVVSLAAILLSVIFASGEVKNIDRRSASTESRYRIIFAARGGSPTGHAFVAWCTEDASKRLSVQDAFGFYPEGGKGVLGEVPGKIADEILSGKLQALGDQLSVLVDESTFKKAEAVRKQWAGRKYKMTETDCVTFVQAVATGMRLKSPERKVETLSPKAFIEALLRLND